MKLVLFTLSGLKITLFLSSKFTFLKNCLSREYFDFLSLTSSFLSSISSVKAALYGSTFNLLNASFAALKSPIFILF